MVRLQPGRRFGEVEGPEVQPGTEGADLVADAGGDGSALLVEMLAKLRSLAPVLRTHASGPGGALELGLASSGGGACRVVEVSCSGQAVFPVVNTVLAETFKLHGMHLHGTSVRVGFGSQVDWSRMGSWLGSAALVLLVGAGPITLQQHRPGREDHSSEVRTSPLLSILVSASACWQRAVIDLLP